MTEEARIILTYNPDLYFAKKALTVLYSKSKCLLLHDAPETISMKVGIITFHPAYNYGAFLQTYALQKTLEKLGHSVEIIDYRPYYLLNPYYPLSKPSKYTHEQKLWIYLGGRILRFWRDIQNINQRRKRESDFKNAVKNYLILSNIPYNNYSDLKIAPPEYDYYITGSDQIWNPGITGGELDPAYFLDFVTKSGKSAAYAASIGKSVLNAGYTTQFRVLIRNIDSITLREASSVPFVEKESGKTVSVTADPTLLLSNDEWEGITKAPKHPVKEYLLVYTININHSISGFINRVSRELNLPVFYIGGGLQKYFPRSSFVSPEEFLWYFKHASFVITDSFHGTVFSIINRRSFYTIQPAENITRVHDLLTSLGIDGRIFSSGDDIGTVQEIQNYDEVYENIEKIKALSLSYLSQIPGEKQDN